MLRATKENLIRGYAAGKGHRGHKKRGKALAGGAADPFVQEKHGYMSGKAGIQGYINDEKKLTNPGVPKGRTKMWEDWNKTSTAVSNQVHRNRHLLEHGLPTMQSNIQEQVGAQQNHHQKKFVTYEQATTPEEYETALVNLKILDPNSQATDTYMINDAESKMLAAGYNFLTQFLLKKRNFTIFNALYDQFSVLFNTKVNHDAPSLIHDKLSDFAREIASSKSHEYLKLAQKCRLFYQDPAITDKLKPVETMHDPFGNARNLHRPFKFEGKSSFQEKPHLLWDWEIDNPDQTRWVRNLVANFMDRSIKDLYDVKKVGLQSLFRAETHEYKFMSVFDTKNSEIKKLQLVNEVDRMYVDLSRKKERVEERLMNEICEPLPDIDPISPFADISIKYASGLTKGLDFGAKDGTAVILVNQPTGGMITDDDVVDWQGEACKMLTTGWFENCRKVCFVRVKSLKLFFDPKSRQKGPTLLIE